MQLWSIKIRMGNLASFKPQVYCKFFCNDFFSFNLLVSRIRVFVLEACEWNRTPTANFSMHFESRFCEKYEMMKCCLVAGVIRMKDHCSIDRWDHWQLACMTFIWIQTQHHNESSVVCTFLLSETPSNFGATIKPGATILYNKFSSLYVELMRSITVNLFIMHPKQQRSFTCFSSSSLISKVFTLF